MAELADALDLGSCEVIRVGSTPTTRTNFLIIGMSKTLICSQRHTIYRFCNNLQFNMLFHNFVKLAFCSSLS